MAINSIMLLILSLVVLASLTSAQSQAVNDYKQEKAKTAAPTPAPTIAPTPSPMQTLAPEMAQPQMQQPVFQFYDNKPSQLYKQDRGLYKARGRYEKPRRSKRRYRRDDDEVEEDEEEEVTGTKKKSKKVKKSKKPKKENSNSGGDSNPSKGDDSNPSKGGAIDAPNKDESQAPSSNPSTPSSSTSSPSQTQAPTTEPKGDTNNPNEKTKKPKKPKQKKPEQTDGPFAGIAWPEINEQPASIVLPTPVQQQVQQVIPVQQIPQVYPVNEGSISLPSLTVAPTFVPTVSPIVSMVEEVVFDYPNRQSSSLILPTQNQTSTPGPGSIIEPTKRLNETNAPNRLYPINNTNNGDIAMPNPTTAPTKGENAQPTPLDDAHNITSTPVPTQGSASNLTLTSTPVPTQGSASNPTLTSTPVPVTVGGVSDPTSTSSPAPGGGSAPSATPPSGDAAEPEMIQCVKGTIQIARVVRGSPIAEQAVKERCNNRKLCMLSDLDVDMVEYDCREPAGVASAPVDGTATPSPTTVNGASTPMPTNGENAPPSTSVPTVNGTSTPSPTSMNGTTSAPQGDAAAPVSTPVNGTFTPTPTTMNGTTQAPQGDAAAPVTVNGTSTPAPTFLNGTSTTPAPQGDAAAPATVNGTSTPAPTFFNGTSSTPAPQGDAAAPATVNGTSTPAPTFLNGTSTTPAPQGDAAAPATVNGTSTPAPTFLNGTSTTPAPQGDAEAPATVNGTSTPAPTFLNGTSTTPAPQGDAVAPLTQPPTFLNGSLVPTPLPTFIAVNSSTPAPTIEMNGKNVTISPATVNGTLPTDAPLGDTIKPSEGFNPIFNTPSISLEEDCDESELMTTTPPTVSRFDEYPTLSKTEEFDLSENGFENRFENGIEIEAQEPGQPMCYESETVDGVQSLACPKEHTIIVKDASFGLQSGSCFAQDQGWHVNPSCHINVVNSVRDQCQNENSCEVSANPATYGRPCSHASGNFKLNVNYICVRPSTPRKTVEPIIHSPTKCFQTRSNGTMSCPTGQVITKISHGTFGTPHGSCKTEFSMGDCHVDPIPSLLDHCLHRSRCDVNASTVVFGAPVCKSKNMTATYGGVVDKTDYRLMTSYKCGYAADIGNETLAHYNASAFDGSILKKKPSSASTNVPALAIIVAFIVATFAL